MDAERFDQFARGLGQRLSRRRFPVLGAAVALIWPVFADEGLTDIAEAKKGKKGKKGKKCKGKNKKKCKGKGKPKPAQCRTSQSDEAVTATATFKQETLTLATVDELPLDPREPLSRTMTIQQKQALLVESQFIIDPSGSVEVRVANGKGYRGFSEAVFTINAGMIGGSIDGRALVPFPATEVPESVQFQDGQPAPEISITGKLQDSIEKLVDQALTASPACEPAAGRGKRAGSPRNHDGNASCLACKARCLWDELVCGNGVRGACAPLTGVPFIGGGLYWACVGLSIVGCVERGVSCLQNCRSNRDCCPVLCGTLPDWSCCHADEQCLTFGTGFGQCCAPGQTACHEVACCNPGDTCMPGGTCCPNTRVCGQHCCGTFTTGCCNGQCCNGECINGACCEGTPCGNNCCAAGQICRSGQCTNPDPCPRRCGDGQCCPEGNVCCGSPTSHCRPGNTCVN